MRLLPRTLVGRTLAVLLVGLTLSHLIGLAIYSGDRSLALTTQSGRDAAERIAAAVRTFEAAEPADRPRLAQSMWAPGFSVVWATESTIAEEDRGWRARLLRLTISRALDGYAQERIRVVRQEAPGSDRPPGLGGLRDATGAGDVLTGGGAHMRHMREMGMGMGMGMGMAAAMDRMDRAWRDGEILEASLQLADGSWLNFAFLTPREEPFWWARFFLSILLMTAVVIAVSVWAVRRAARPLAVFSRAAERLGLDVNAPPVAEAGPHEVSQLARAFNAMQGRLNTFVQDRTQMLAAISHDLRTPITRLRLRADFVEDEEQRQKMLADLDQMEAMIAATLSFAREDVAQEPGRPFDLAVLLQDLCDDAAESGHRAAYQGPTAFTYRGRPLALKRAFANLIDNAVKYGEAAEVSLVAADGVATVVVEDSGPGIPEDEQDKVFAPFYRLEGSRCRDTGGVGLGLASVRSIVRAHGGQVVLANRETRGLRVTVTLP
ncbi:MAG: ATP-binding protein [Rhodospirillales bacterium]|nr:ATP-binding protein [Rhodospirillales bacterium]